MGMSRWEAASETARLHGFELIEICQRNVSVIQLTLMPLEKFTVANTELMARNLGAEKDLMDGNLFLRHPSENLIAIMVLA